MAMDLTFFWQYLNFLSAFPYDANDRQLYWKTNSEVLPKRARKEAALFLFPGPELPSTTVTKPPPILSCPYSHKCCIRKDVESFKEKKPTIQP